MVYIQVQQVTPVLRVQQPLRELQVSLEQLVLGDSLDPKDSLVLKPEHSVASQGQ